MDLPKSSPSGTACCPLQRQAALAASRHGAEEKRWVASAAAASLRLATRSSDWAAFPAARPHMGTVHNVSAGRQRIRCIASTYQNQSLRISAQCRDSVGRHRAIFHRLIVGPEPEKRLSACRQQCQQDGEATGAPSPGEDFVQATGPKASAQHRIRLWMTCGHRYPLRRQSIMRQRMAQFRQLCIFVHGMFYNASSRFGVNPNPLFVNHSQNAGALIKLTHT
jgi:hypothetical protein